MLSETYGEPQGSGGGSFASALKFVLGDFVEGRDLDQTRAVEFIGRISRAVVDS